MNVRLKQALALGIGAVAAVVMTFLGLWQAQVFVDKGDRTVAARAEQPPVPLLDHIHPDGTFGDIYGKQVTVHGRYLPEQQFLVPIPGGGEGRRVLTAFQVADGRVVPVVRGMVRPGERIPPPPEGGRTESGLFLPGEGDEPDAATSGELASVRMPLLAQKWPQQLTPGFVTLGASAAQAQGMAQAPVSLPHGEGSAQNGAYALQWWVFAAVALGGGIKLAQSFGEADRRRREADALARRDTVVDTDPEREDASA